MDLQHWQSQFEAWLVNHHNQQDAAHDIFHFRRVWATSRQLSRGLAVDELVVLTACYFHDIVSLAKNHPERHRSSVLAAAEARRILIHDFPGFPASRLAAVCHAIEAHSFSANIAPVTLEAKIVQDADRLEALGAIGLARHNADFLVTYMAKLSAELKGEYASLDATVIAAFSPNHA